MPVDLHLYVVITVALTMPIYTGRVKQICKYSKEVKTVFSFFLFSFISFTDVFIKHCIYPCYLIISLNVVHMDSFKKYMEFKSNRQLYEAQTENILHPTLIPF